MSAECNKALEIWRKHIRHKFANFAKSYYYYDILCGSYSPVVGFWTRFVTKRGTMHVNLREFLADFSENKLSSAYNASTVSAIVYSICNSLHYEREAAMKLPIHSKYDNSFYISNIMDILTEIKNWYIARDKFVPMDPVVDRDGYYFHGQSQSYYISDCDVLRRLPQWLKNELEAEAKPKGE